MQVKIPAGTYKMNETPTRKSTKGEACERNGENDEGGEVLREKKRETQPAALKFYLFASCLVFILAVKDIGVSRDAGERIFFYVSSVCRNKNKMH